MVMLLLWSVAPFLGPIFMGLLALNFLRQYGQRWEFGQYGMPESLLSADGLHYADGTVVDPTILHLIQSGHEAEFYLGFMTFLALAGLWVVAELRVRQRLLRQIAWFRAQVPGVEP